MVMVTAPRQVCVFAHKDGKVMTAPLQTAQAIASDMELVPLANVFAMTATLVLTALNQDVLPTAPTMACALKASATLASANVMLGGLAKTAAANHAQMTAPMDRA